MSDAGGDNASASAALVELDAAVGHPDRPLPAQPHKPARRRRVMGGVILALMGVSAAYSANAWGLRDRYRPPASYLGGRTAVAPRANGPAIADEPLARPAHDIRSQPWWQLLTTFGGEADTTTEAFAVDRHALQWRVKWKCTRGSFSAVPVSDSGERRSLAQASCPAEDTGYSVKTGGFAIRVTAAGPWEMAVEQQVDVPMIEPPPPGIDAPQARPLATATMYDVDRVGKGTARIVVLPDGRRVLRLDDFFVSINSDLEIWFSEHPYPKTTPDAASAPHRRLEFLKATTGAMNYEIPPDLDLSRYRSIVIWCELTTNAYAAAKLEPA